jgi:hypothetical protein
MVGQRHIREQMQDKKNIIVRTCGLYSDVLPVDLLQGEEGWEPFDHSLSI